MEMLKRTALTSSLLLVLAPLALSSACTNELEPGDPDVEFDVSGDDALEDEGFLTASSECSKDAILARAPNDERLWTLAVAERWIDLGITYARGATFEGYRRDCSGFVSMAWGLPKPGPATANFEPFADYSKTVEIPIDQLIPGDAVNRRTRRVLSDGSNVGHIRLFGGWINKNEGTHCILEYYSTGKVGRAMKGTRADLADYIGLRNTSLPTTPRPSDGAGAPAEEPPPPSTPNPHANTPGCGVLLMNESLAPNQSKYSCDGRFQFVHQGDGNVVLYGPTGALWSSRTNGQSTKTLVMQGDGNLVLYRTNDSAAWNTRTQGNTTAALVVQDDGNVVVYGANWRVLWASNTAGH